VSGLDKEGWAKVRELRRKEAREKKLNKKRVSRRQIPKSTENSQTSRLKSLFEGFIPKARMQINQNLLNFEELSKHRINIFYGKDMMFAEAIKHCLDGVGHPIGDELDPEDYPEFAWAKGMGWPHFKKMAEICIELERVGACYIIEGKLTNGRGRPDITVLWKNPEFPEDAIHGLIGGISGNFHIEVLESEDEEKSIPDKRRRYPFPIITVRAEA